MCVIFNPKGINDFKNKVIEIYGANVSKSKLNEYVLSEGNYIWHLFSFNLIDSSEYLSGNDAMNAYDLCDKENAIVYEMRTNSFMSVNSDFMTSKRIAEKYEVYVFANDLSWIYFKTHEESLGLGPYFIKKK